MNRREFLLGAIGTTLAAPVLAAKQSLGIIAFAQIDGLWVRALPDGEPRNLAGGPVSFPRFSTSGRWITYQQNESTYVISLDGKQLRRIGERAVWSPVSDQLWSRNETSGTLELFSERNAWTSPVATIPYATLGVFSPNGSEMIYAVQDSTDKGGDIQQSTRLLRVTLQDRAAPVLLHSTSEDWTPCAWTRDGKLLFWRQEEFSASEASDGDELLLMSLSDGAIRSLGVTVLLDSDFISLSPVRNELAVTAGEGRYERYDKRVAVADLESLAVQYLIGKDTVGLCPKWSPDGNSVAYSAGPAPAAAEQPDLEWGGEENALRLNQLLSQRRIWVSDRAGSATPRELTSDPRYHDEEPLWSADGGSILFTRSDSGFQDIHTLSSAGKTLWLMDQDGGNPVQVAGPLYVDPNLLGVADRWCAFDWFPGGGHNIGRPAA